MQNAVYDQMRDMVTDGFFLLSASRLMTPYASAISPSGRGSPSGTGVAAETGNDRTLVGLALPRHCPLISAIRASEVKSRPIATSSSGSTAETAVRASPRRL